MKKDNIGEIAVFGEGCFWCTEHEDYYARNKNAPYCQIIINPKLEKVQKQFANLLKTIV
ncbi:MAG TPA: hypothetical protein VJI66_00360 [Candidatus Paceibacterota bacterium]